MNELSEPFAVLVEAAQSGDINAANTLLSKFEPALRAAVRRQLPTRLRSLFDSLDFTQDVWVSFFRPSEGRTVFQTPEQLSVYLAAMARHKLTDLIRQRFYTQKYAKDREECAGTENNLDAVSGQSSATASQVAIAGETFHDLLKRLPVAHQAILHRLREGYQREQIAEMSGLSLRTVDRIIHRLKELTKGVDLS